MNRIRNILSFLLIAGVACVHAQQPIVKINGGSTQASGCDVTAAAGAPIFQLDATGNVLVNGQLSGTGCGGGGGTNTPTFGLNPAPAALLINGGSSVQAGSIASVPLTYRAYYANSCSVGAPTTTGTCPAIGANAANNCTGSGSPLSCSPASGALSVPTAASMGANTSCTYTATANCGGVTSPASLIVTSTPIGGGGDIPPECASLASIHASTGAAWSRLTSKTSVRYGDGTVASNVDSTDYVAMWSYPGTSTPWPGTANSQSQPNVNSMMYLSEKFVVSSDTSLIPRWSWTGSGNGTNFSTAVSICPGDFGQTGTQLTQGCKRDQGQSSSGLTAYVNATQQGTACTLNPGKTYYLNILPNANLPVNNISSPSDPACTGGTCKPWTKRT